MNINFIAMGKLKESWYREACAEYMKRLGAYVSPKVIEPSPVDLPQKPSQAQIDAALRQEASKDTRADKARKLHGCDVY